MDAVDKLRQHLKEMGISQSELARMSGLHFATINRILNRSQEFKPNTMVKIADALNIKISDLTEDSISFNYSVQGYLQFNTKITHITSFEQLKKWVEKHEPMVNALLNQTNTNRGNGK